MTMRKKRNNREIIKNMVLLRKHNTIKASLKYLEKPSDKTIPLLILIIGSLQKEMFFQSAPWRMETTFAYKTIQFVSY